VTDVTAVAAVAASFGRDVDANLAAIAACVSAARDRGAGLLALPEACLGGYLSVLGRGRDGEFDEAPDSLPPVMSVDGPELRQVAALAREMTVVAGFCERDGGERYNSTARSTSRSGRACTTRPAASCGRSTPRRAASAR